MVPINKMPIKHIMILPIVIPGLRPYTITSGLGEVGWWRYALFFCLFFVLRILATAFPLLLCRHVPTVTSTPWYPWYSSKRFGDCAYVDASKGSPGSLRSSEASEEIKTAETKIRLVLLFTW